MIEAVFCVMLIVLVYLYEMRSLRMIGTIKTLQREREQLLFEQRQWLESDERYAAGFAKIR